MPLVAAAAVLIILTSPQAKCQLTAETATLMGGRRETKTTSTAAVGLFFLDAGQPTDSHQTVKHTGFQMLHSNVSVKYGQIQRPLIFRATATDAASV